MHLLSLAALLFVHCASRPVSTSSVPLGAPLSTDAAGVQGLQARISVMRVQCLAPPGEGTGFLHRSGAVITAAHVIEGCSLDSLRLLPSSGVPQAVARVRANPDVDLALVFPSTPISGTPLQIAGSRTEPTLGSQVTTWGFPSPYTGLNPLLTVGYFAGSERVRLTPASTLKQWVMNAPFNPGNSGGPVLSVETGLVIGVVSNKPDPMPTQIQDSLKVLATNPSGVMYSRTYSDGRVEPISEAQVVAEILAWFRRQTQLVIGRTVTLADLRAFLTESGVTP